MQSADTEGRGTLKAKPHLFPRRCCDMGAAITPILQDKWLRFKEMVVSFPKVTQLATLGGFISNCSFYSNFSHLDLPLKEKEVTELLGENKCSHPLHAL
jgi:hypothetical protein